MRVIACLAEGVGLRSTARVFEVGPNTVPPWLVEAADNCEPLPPIACMTYTGDRGSWTSSMPCSVLLRTEPSPTTTPSRR